MELHNPLIKGTFILTVTGLLTRFMGFFYRIFLSHTFGAVQVGLYQLIFPIYALGYSATCAGIQTILSRSDASRLVQGRKKEARQLLYTGPAAGAETAPQSRIGPFLSGREAVCVREPVPEAALFEHGTIRI